MNEEVKLRDICEEKLEGKKRNGKVNFTEFTLHKFWIDKTDTDTVC